MCLMTSLHRRSHAGGGRLPSTYQLVVTAEIDCAQRLPYELLMIQQKKHQELVVRLGPGRPGNEKREGEKPFAPFG